MDVGEDPLLLECQRRQTLRGAALQVDGLASVTHLNDITLSDRARAARAKAIRKSGIVQNAAVVAYVGGPFLDGEGEKKLEAQYINLIATGELTEMIKFHRSLLVDGCSVGVNGRYPTRSSVILMDKWQQFPPVINSSTVIVLGDAEMDRIVNAELTRDRLADAELQAIEDASRERMAEELTKMNQEK